MRFILDTNEFIGAFGVVKHLPSETLLDILIDSFPNHTLHIPRLIINETQRNMHAHLFADFIKTIQPIAAIDEDISVPFEIGAKYEALGLKNADAFIAAYAEWIGADVLVTENRHFLTRRAGLPFKVLTAEQCLRLFVK